MQTEENKQDFAVGQVVKMAVAEWSHVKNPYYVVITGYYPEAKKGETIMITAIPGRHSCKMIVGSNWEYHKPRMTIIGPKEEHGHLLLNQKFD